MHVKLTPVDERQCGGVAAAQLGNMALIRPRSYRQANESSHWLGTPVPHPTRSANTLQGRNLRGHLNIVPCLSRTLRAALSLGI